MEIEPSHTNQTVNPRLTIAVGVYNDAKFLRGGLEALLSQTYTDFELVISDNASTDETAQIIQEFAQKDSRVRVFRQPKNVGLIRNYNFLRHQARGEYYMWSACDDRCAPDYVRTVIAGMEANPEVVLGFTPYRFINEEGEPFDPPRIYDFSGSNALVRLLKYFYLYDDGMVYGIYRYAAIKDQDFPIWWWINKNTPLNTGFAFLSFVLSRGQFQLFGEEPLWFNCIKTAEHYQPFKQKRRAFEYFLFFFLRKINVACIQFNNIRRGSRSILLAMLMIPVLILRVLADTFILFKNIVTKISKKSPANQPE